MDAHERLKWAREQAGFKSATEAATVLQIPPPSYLAYENGGRGFAKYASRFAALYRVNPDWLMWGRGTPKPGRPHPAVEIYDQLPPERRDQWLEMGEFLGRKQ